MGKTNLYTIVTNDEFELPVISDLKVKEAAKFLGCTENYVRRMINRPVKKLKYKPIVSGSISHDHRAYQKKYAMTHDRTEYYHLYYQNRKRSQI